MITIIINAFSGCSTIAVAPKHCSCCQAAYVSICVRPNAFAWLFKCSAFSYPFDCVVLPWIRACRVCVGACRVCR